MSKELENNKQNKTPALYTFYGKQYDFNDLKRDSDLGFKDYLRTLRRGNKDSEELWNAYSNMMSGIGDGSITFENGRFNDSLGRYSNGVYYDNDGKKQTSKKKSRDYYGLVANYIAGKLGKSQEYQEPKELEDKTKIKWSGNNSLGLAFNRKMFNTDNGNIMDFIDLDPYDEGTKSRKTDNRIKLVKDVTKYLYDNFDSLFTGYSDADSLKAKLYLEEAMASLDDNTVNSGDYLALSRAFGGINWRNMFSNLLSYTAQLDQLLEDLETPILKFANWKNLKYRKYTGTLLSRQLQPGTLYSASDKTLLLNVLNSLPEEDIKRITRFILSAKGYKFYADPAIANALGNNTTLYDNLYGLQNILEVLKNKGLLTPVSKSNTNLFYIPNTATKDNIGWVWDSSKNTISQMHIDEIPYWQLRMLLEYKGETGGDLAWAEPYLKEGGIIKALKGVLLNSNANWYSGVFTPQLDHILSTLKGDSNYYKWLNDMLDKHSALYKSAGDNFTNTAYENDLVKKYQDAYKAGYNGEWKDNLFGYNSLGILNAYDKGMFNIGENRTSGDKAGQWTSDSLYSGITDYRRLLGRKGDYSDNQLSEITLKFKDAGYSFDLGDDGYYRLNPLLGKIERPVSSVALKPDIPLLISVPKVALDTKKTYVDPRKEREQEQLVGSRNWNISPDLIGAGRLVSSIVTNNRVTDTIMKSLKPVLKDTYERYSPITGAFGEMQFRNNLAANLRSQAAKPFTSDASLQLAGLLDADRQARDLEYLGFLADNNEIKRTREAALARMEDNMARRSEVANFNRASINLTGRERALLLATNLKKNWESVDNFLQGIEGRLRTKMDGRNNFRLQTSMSNINSRYLDLTKQATNDVSTWMSSNPGKALSSMPNYTNYTNYISDMQKWKLAQLYKAHADIYGYDYDNDWLHKTPESIGLPYGYKRGGSLKPSTMYLINKVIKNESNT